MFFLDILNFVSSSLNVYIITTKSNYKNKDINNTTILMNIIYEASILLTISDEMLSMQKYCCYDTDYKNTCIVCIWKLWYLNTLRKSFISSFNNCLLGIEISCYGICCYARNNGTTFSS